MNIKVAGGYMEQNEKHSVRLEDRNDLVMSGIYEVLSFDEGFIELALEEGSLTVDGQGLRITEFDSEHHRLTAQGTVSAITYYDRAPKKSGGFFGRRRG